MIDLSLLLAHAADLFDVSDGAIRDGRSRSPRMVAARQAVAYVLYERQYTVVEIGAILYRDHTTICYALKHARRRMASDAAFRANVQELLAGLMPPPPPPPPRTVAQAVERRRDAWVVEESVHIALYWWGIAEPVTP